MGRVAANHGERHGALRAEAKERDGRKDLRDQEVVIPLDLRHEIKTNLNLRPHVGRDVRRTGEEEAAVSLRDVFVPIGAGKRRLQSLRDP